MARSPIAAVLVGILTTALVSSAAEQAGRSPTKAQGGPIRAVTAKATPLFVSRDGRLRRIVEVKVDLAAPATDLVLRVAAGAEMAELRLPQAARTVAQDLEVPDVTEPTDSRVTATAGGQSQSTSLTLRPQRKWRPCGTCRPAAIEPLPAARAPTCPQPGGKRERPWKAASIAPGSIRRPGRSRA